VDLYNVLGLPADFDGAQTTAPADRGDRGGSGRGEGGEDDTDAAERDGVAPVLRRAYRAATRRLHPDKKSGSVEGFQRAVLAFERLGDPTARLAYDRGEDLASGLGGGGSGGGGVGSIGNDGQAGASRFQSFSVAEEVVAHYFPHTAGFRAFGDPFERRRDQEARRRQGNQQRRRY
jgi:DnaJ-class molecular chaperone